MIDEKTLQNIVQHIVAAAQPSRVILFGSYGRGDADEDSDVDLMVIKPRIVNRGEEMIQLYQLVGQVGAGVDVLLYSDAEYDVAVRFPAQSSIGRVKKGKDSMKMTKNPTKIKRLIINFSHIHKS